MLQKFKCYRSFKLNWSTIPTPNASAIAINNASIILADPARSSPEIRSLMPFVSETPGTSVMSGPTITMVKVASKPMARIKMMAKTAMSMDVNQPMIFRMKKFRCFESTASVIKTVIEEAM